ncbi:MAG: nucleoside triphosphate pyrophosphohydrolase family protein [Candidatus Wallacebacter cryptica]
MNQFDDYQEQAKRTLNTEVKDLYLYANLGMGLAGEAGEVCDYLKKVVFHGHELDAQKVEEELGDVLWYLANLADAVGLSLSEIAEKNIAKLRKRYPNGFEQVRSQERG